MPLTGIVKKAVESQMDEIAMTILVELMDACPVRTGKTAESFEIMKYADGLRYIGSTALSAFYADQGNGGRGHIITPISKRALKLKDGSIRKSVHGYDGTHFVAQVASRHR